jgi:hypothetical protein
MERPQPTDETRRGKGNAQKAKETIEFACAREGQHMDGKALLEMNMAMAWRQGTEVGGNGAFRDRD